jgi:hypothetical protein
VGLVRIVQEDPTVTSPASILAGATYSATLSPCGTYRYRLGRAWSAGPKLLFVMLNPSTADAATDDATIRRCASFASASGFGGLEVVNLFAYRSTKPIDLRRAGWPTGGADADRQIEEAARICTQICVAWGAVSDSGPAVDRVQQVMPILRRAGHEPHCLSVTRSGHPGHPLYLDGACKLKPFDYAAIQAAMAGART